ncbi:MAG: PH domain-containing protein [Halobacteriota archaeon]
MKTLHPRIRLVWIARSLLAAVIVGAAGGAGSLYLDLPIEYPIAIAVVIFVVGTVHSILRYRKWRYVIREDSLYLERGVLTEVRTVVPLVRIQHVDSRRSAVERVLGLASTVVYTAGSRGADVRIPGLEPDTASDLRERLKRLAIEAEGEDAV